MSVKSKAKGLGLLMLGAAGGAAVQWFLDPVQGRTRRARTADQMGAAARDVAREAERQADYQAGRLQGAVVEATSFGSRPAPDDKTLKHRVESEVLGREGMPKGAVSVHAEGGVVELRGQVDRPETMTELLARTRAVDGVRDVRSLLHLPGQDEPGTAEARRASRAAEERAGHVS